MSDAAAIVLAVALLAGNAFFVGAEFALVSARRTQIEPRAAAGSTPARITLRAMTNVSLMMAGAQFGITVCSVGLGAVGEPAVAHLLEGPFAAAGVPEALLHPVALAIALAIVVFLHMVLGEMVPKNIALAGPDRAALVLGPPLYAVVTALRPLIWLLNHGANLVLRLVKVTPRDEVSSSFTHEEVAGFVAEARREGLLDDQEHDLLTGALAFTGRNAGNVAVPTDDLVVARPTYTVAQLEDLCADTGYSRFPVLDDDSDGFRGYVHLKDLLGLPAEDRHDAIDARAVRPLATVASSDSLQDVLRTMQRRGAHLAEVRDETGALMGVAALEDVLEELVGEVRDATQNAHQQDPRTPRQLPDHAATPAWRA